MRLVFVLLVSLCVVGCTAVTIGEEEVFYPKASVTPHTFDLPDVRLEDRFVPVTDSVQVNAWHLTKPDARVTTLFFGGNGFYLVQSRSYLRALTRPPANAFLWDYRGYGRSEGTPSVPALRHDAIAVYDHLVEARGVDSSRLLVWGHSLGSFLATYVATEREVAGVVLENPATNVEDWVDHLIPWYLRLFLGVDVDPALREEDNLERIRRLRVPLLVVAGGEDEVTDPEMARALHARAGSEWKELVVVKEGGHNGLHEESEVQSLYRKMVEDVAE